MISRQRATTSAAPQPAQRHNQRSATTSERSAASQPASAAQRHNQRAQRSVKTSAATKLPFGTLFADNVVKCN